jgi:hypothetical protein
VHLKTGEVAYRAARTVELFAFSAKGLTAGSLLNVLGCDAIAGLAAGVIVVDV